MTERYHFHLRDAAGLILDEEGADYADLPTARIEALASARELAIEDMRNGVSPHAWSVEITKDDGVLLDRVGISGV